MKENHAEKQTKAEGKKSLTVLILVQMLRGHYNHNKSIRIYICISRASENNNSVPSLANVKTYLRLHVYGHHN